MTATGRAVITNTVTTLLSGLILALLLSECRQNRQTHDAVIRLEAKQQADKERK